jgi:peptidoglycan-associated lipoprotein
MLRRKLMLARYLMIFAVVFTLGACSSDDEAMVDEQGTAMSQEQGTGEGPLSGIYDQNMGGAAPGTQADLVTSVGDRVLFGYDRYDISPEARTILEGQASWLNRYPNLSITIEGHCDERGTREYNLALGERRANAVKSFLIALGVDAGRINTISYGKERPAVPGADESAWSQNRRGVTKVD